MQQSDINQNPENKFHESCGKQKEDEIRKRPQSVQ